MRSAGGVKWPVTFTGFLPLLKIHTERIWYWTGHRSCERHHLSVKRSHAACEIWWEETKARERKKNQGQNTFSMVKEQEESLALLYITLNCDTCKRQHYQLEAMSDCQFVIHFNNCHGPVRNYVSFNIGSEQKSTGRQTSRWNAVKAPDNHSSGHNKEVFLRIPLIWILAKCYARNRPLEVKGYDTD